MATQKRPHTKPLHLPPFTIRELRHDLLHQRVKHPQAFPQLGELPPIAGLLLYPDKREKMVTTSEIAFSPKPHARTEPKKLLQCSLTLEGEQSFVTTNQVAYRPQLGDDLPLMMRRKNLLKQESDLYQTIYQQNFIQPKGIYTRRLQVLPCADNLTINPALRADFRTVQMETYPGWDICLHSRPVPAQLKEQLSLKEDLLMPSVSTKTSSLIRSVKAR